ncbi:amidase [Antribacter gilvus]|uniref:amidase n=1 Tax=Antribacter gilvus TaxID=2304675 RepID=UPI000F780FCF|nr:amidase family protein [Antribacter gilvus]
MTADIAFTSARALAARIAAREVSAVEVLDARLTRIRDLNPGLNAVVSLDPDAATDAARRADDALARGIDVGPLHGVPITLKDGHDVAGMRTTIGTPVFDRVPDRDGTVAARLRAAGAIIVGHTNVPPFLGDYIAENPIFGRTSNPWDTQRTAGGSSGGAASALASGLTPVEVGSDLAGSLRVPTHFCGVYGLKATEHRIPITGFFRPVDGTAQSVRIMTSLGPMARDLDDLELMLRLMAGPDGLDSDVPPVALPARRKRSPGSLRLAWAPELPGAPVTDELRAEVERVAGEAAAAGAVVHQRLPGLDWSGQRVFGELMSLTEVYAPGAEQTTLDWYFHALERRDRWVSAWERFFDDYDALILPPAASVAFLHGATGTDEQGRSCVFANLAGLPALTLPAGMSAGRLPIGVQIVGPRWSEIQLLEVAACLEDRGILPGFVPPY